MTFRYWTLDGHNAVGTNDVAVWGRWFENVDNRRVAYDDLGDARVSTVFLGIDHAFGNGPPKNGTQCASPLG